ncbi:hypothetical protein CBS9595_002489 [Malassezia furfur]|nr:hypothetical protein CBS9595_002489 [Malassezia furfur]
MLRWAWIALAVCATQVVASAPRGVAPQDASLYEPHLDKHGVAMWKCLGTDQRIPHSRINDDYCDCEDGSDEPGTSACDEGRFYCANAGHIPKYIRSSFVNDGVCDCCDGSDEAEGKTHCPNVCAQMNKEYRKETAQAEKKYQAGAKIRERYVSSAAQDREFHRKNLARLYTELPEAERTEAQLKQALEDAESVSAWLEQQKRSSPLFAQLELRQATLRAQREALDKLAGELRIVAQMVERLGGVPSKEDIADIRDAYHIWLGRVFDDHDEERQATLDEKLSQLLRSGTEFSEEDLQTLINEDPLTLLDGAPDYAVLHIPSYLPESLVPLYERGLQWLVDVLVRLEAIPPPPREKGQAPHNYKSRVGVAAARDAYEKSRDAVNRIKGDVEYHNKALENLEFKYGRDGEFKTLDGTCLKRDMGEYTYEFCFGGTTSQISNNDGYTFQLGNDYRHYLTMLYDRGQSCWNGPQRSTRVTLECSDKNELLDVFEAEKCTYSMRVATPAVCFPKEEEPIKQEVEHTEL